MKKQQEVFSTVITPCELYGSPSWCYGEADVHLESKSSSQTGRAKEEDGGQSSRLGSPMETGEQQLNYDTRRMGEWMKDRVDHRSGRINVSRRKKIPGIGFIFRCTCGPDSKKQDDDNS